MDRSKDAGGYRLPPNWTDGIDGNVRPTMLGKRTIVVRIEQVQLFFPVDSDAEYQWRFADGTSSPWKAAPKLNKLRAPPGAEGVFWRRRGDKARRREPTKAGRANARVNPNARKPSI